MDFSTPASGSSNKSHHYMCGNLLRLPSRPNVIIQIYCKLTFRGIVCWGKKENILYPSLHSCSGQIGGSAEDLLRDVDSWAHSAGRWVSDTRMRLWNRTRVIPGHLHTASIPVGSSHPPSLPLLPPFAPSLSAHLPVLVFSFSFLFFSLLKSLHLLRSAPNTH